MWNVPRNNLIRFLICTRHLIYCWSELRWYEHGETAQNINLIPINWVSDLDCCNGTSFIMPSMHQNHSTKLEGIMMQLQLPHLSKFNILIDLNAAEFKLFFWYLCSFVTISNELLLLLNIIRRCFHSSYIIYIIFDLFDSVCRPSIQNTKIDKVLLIQANTR